MAAIPRDNRVGEIAPTHAERESRAKTRQCLEIYKVAAIVSTVVAFLLFAVFPHLFTGILLGLVGYASYEVCAVVRNGNEQLEDEVAGNPPLPQEIHFNRMTRGAPLIRSIVTILNPMVNPA